MNFDRTSNPTFSESRLRKLADSYAGTGPMTMQGTATKTLLLFALLLLTASITWKLFGVGSSALTPCMFIGGIGALVFGIVTCLKPEKAHICGPIYAVCEGLLLGAVSASFATEFNGIVISAVLLTIAVSAVVFLCYRCGILKASGTFVKVISYATIGIAVFYLLSFILSFFGIHLSLMNLGWVGIVLQLVIVGIAAMNLVLDFNNVESSIEAGVSARYEWYFSFGLMVTIVWIYIEILRLLAMIMGRSRD